MAGSVMAFAPNSINWTTSLVTLACVLTESFSGFGIGLNVSSPARMKKRVP